MLTHRPQTLDALTIHRMPRPILRGLAIRRFRDQVRFVMEHVPYYREAYRRAGVRVDEITDYRTAARVPAIDKSVIKEHVNELFSEGAPPPERMYKRSSSGSSGRPSGPVMEWV